MFITEADLCENTFCPRMKEVWLSYSYHGTCKIPGLESSSNRV